MPLLERPLVVHRCASRIVPDRHCGADIVENGCRSEIEALLIGDLHRILRSRHGIDFRCRRSLLLAVRTISAFAAVSATATLTIAPAPAPVAGFRLAAERYGSGVTCRGNHVDRACDVRCPRFARRTRALRLAGRLTLRDVRAFVSRGLATAVGCGIPPVVARSFAALATAPSWLTAFPATLTATVTLAPRTLARGWSRARPGGLTLALA